MTTIQIETELRIPGLKDLTPYLFTDWAPVLSTTAKRVAAVLVAVYTAGLIAGLRWRQLLAWAERHHHLGLSRLGLPGGDLDPRQLPSIEVPLPVVIDLEAMARGERHLPPVSESERVSPISLPSPIVCEACHRLRSQGLRPAAIARRMKISRRAVDEVLAA